MDANEKRRLVEEIRLSVSSSKQHFDGLAGLIHSREEIDRMNFEYDDAMKRIAEIEAS